MRNTSIILLFIFSLKAGAQPVNNYFEKIRNDAAALTAFFQQMPKGGDLHHHYSGSVYTETFVNAVVNNDYYLNKATLEVLVEKPVGDNNNWERFSALKQNGSLFNFKQLLLQKWSAKDYVDMGYPTHRQFFESFRKFNIGAELSFAEGLQELKNRAKAESLSYIETSAHTIHCNANMEDLYPLGDSMRWYSKQRDQQNLFRLLDKIYTASIANGAGTCAIKFDSNMQKIHDSLHIDDAGFTMRYQTFVIRNSEPVELFKNTVVAFEAVTKSPLMTGVNIVAPEHYDVAMSDYWLHMQFFNYCHAKYPNVKYSMHAGELTLGLVKPEELTWHIGSAVYDAKANRIGHGVDMAYEKDNYSLLKYMAKNKIAIEINLGSNEFILNVKEDRHPIMLYKNAGVPIVISTDDAGILRTNITEQYVLLAKRYPSIKYADIKQFVYNSIEYSFIKEPAVKQSLKAKLDVDFKVFENKMRKIASNK